MQLQYMLPGHIDSGTLCCIRPPARFLVAIFKCGSSSSAPYIYEKALQSPLHRPVTMYCYEKMISLELVWNCRLRVSDKQTCISDRVGSVVN
jgi:hypothetical protein